MDAAAAAIDAFEALVTRAESSADTQPRAELARFQLQALAGTLAALGDLPPSVDGALETLRAHVVARDGAVDRDEGARLREKVGAYVVLADDLGLDRGHLESLVARWDATAGRRATGKGRRSSATTAQGSP